MSLWLLITSAMPLFWSGYNQRYWFTQTVVFFIFSALTSKSLNQRQRQFNNAITISLIIMLFVVNFFGTIIYSTSNQNDLTYKQIEPLTHTAKSGDLVIYKTPWTLEFYINTYLPGVKFIGLGFLDSENKIKNAEYDLCNISKVLENNNVYVLEEVFEDKSNLSPSIQKEINDIAIKYYNTMRYNHNKYIKYYKISK